MHWGAHWGSGWFLGMHLIWWLVGGALIAAFWFTTSRSDRSLGEGATESTADILRRRYAAGELTTAEYDARLARLTEPDTASAGNPS